MAELDKLVVRVEATTDQLRREMGRAEQQVTNASRQMDLSMRRFDGAMTRSGQATQAWRDSLAGDIAGMQEGLFSETGRASAASREIGRTLSSHFEDAIVEGKELRDVVRGLAQDLLQVAVRRASRQPLQEGLSGLMDSMIGGLFGGRLFGRQGGGSVNPSQAYLVGEHGPEIVVPKLPSRVVPQTSPARRDGNAAAAPVQISFQVSTPDVEGFRRSESQITAMLARSLSRGNRNL